MSNIASSARAEPVAGFPQGPRLLADVGDNTACFALQSREGSIGHLHVLPCRDFATLEEAIRAYLAREGVAAIAPAVRQAAMSVAASQAVAGNDVQATHAPWSFSIGQLREAFNFDTLLVVRSATALARALPLLGGGARQTGGGRAEEGAPLGLICAEANLGIAGLLPANGGWTVLETEGGLTSFSPVNEIEVEILRLVRRDFGYVSAERLVSTAGIELIYRSLAALRDVPAENLDHGEIVRRALGGSCLLCDETIETFCAMLGTVAGNLAVTLGARGGVYTGGRIVAMLGDRFDRSAFRARFENKGRFNAYPRAIPTFVIAAGHAALTGASALLSERLGRQ